MATYSLGIDLGSSSVKVSILNLESGKVVGSAQSPADEMEIDSPKPGWAEQNPQIWWEHTSIAIRNAIKAGEVVASEICAVGIAYQMHGLVAINSDNRPIRPSIIWCDSRAAIVGDEAFAALGKDYCLSHLLNSPGNFTASKLAWVKENEPEVYRKISKVMLPGDYIAMRLSGKITTTISGLSEGIFWDFLEEDISMPLLEYFDIEKKLLPDITPGFGYQCTISDHIADQFGFSRSIPITYRAGDQPNNALSLNALEPGEVAATAGTSGVIYAVCDQPISDMQSRVNTFVHVNHDKDSPRYGVLLCVNGTGIMNSWIRKLVGRDTLSYTEMNELAASVEPGSDGLLVYPFGNGIERVLENQTPGASIAGLDLNRHSTEHILRATQEGIAFAMKYGFDVLGEIGIKATVIRVGHANMFLSEVFCEVFVNSIGVPIEVFDTDGAAGAARGAAIGLDPELPTEDMFRSLKMIKKVEPEEGLQQKYSKTYKVWKKGLQNNLKNIK